MRPDFYFLFFSLKSTKEGKPLIFVEVCAKNRDLCFLSSYIVKDQKRLKCRQRGKTHVRRLQNCHKQRNYVRFYLNCTQYLCKLQILTETCSVSFRYLLQGISFDKLSQKYISQNKSSKAKSFHFLTIYLLSNYFRRHPI